MTLARGGWIAAIAWMACGCVSGGGNSEPLQPVPHSEEVEVGKSEPGPGAVSLGPLEIIDGTCAVLGRRAGAFGVAMLKLRNLAVALGANYLSLISSSEVPARCGVTFFALRAFAYRIPKQSQVAVPPAAADGETCTPPCSPGYSCVEQTCAAVCNPVCAASQVCRQDRTCGDPPSSQRPASAPPAQ